MKKMTLLVLFVLSVFFLEGCVHALATTFPSPDDVFITTGDGDIQKPYTPIGQLVYVEEGYRIGLPIIGLIPIHDVDVDHILKTVIFSKVRGMGGDALINMHIAWEPATTGLLGFMANGGKVTITGTVIKR